MITVYFYLSFLFIIGAVSFTFFVVSWRRGETNSSAFSALMFFLTVISVGYAMELWGASFSTKFSWFVVKYAGLAFTPVVWFEFVQQYTEKKKSNNLRRIALLGIIPVITVALTAYSLSTSIMFRSIQLVEVQEISFLANTRGPFFWLHTIYSYGLFLLGYAGIIRQLKQRKRFYLSSGSILIIGGLLPFTSNMLTLLNVQVFPHLDLTPLGLTLGVFVLSWVLFGMQLIGINPIARASLIESLKDGVIVIDNQRNITDINPAACHMLGQSDDLLDQPVENWLPEKLNLPTFENTDTYPHQEIKLRDRYGSLRDIDIRASPLMDRSRHLMGWSLLLRDITEQKKLRVEIENKSKRLAALAEIELSINQPNELVGVLRQIVNATYELLPARGGVTIFTWNEDSRTFEFPDSTIPRDELAQLVTRARQGKGSAPWIIEHQKPVIVEDTHQDQFGDAEVLIEKNILAYIGLPLIANGKTMGVLYANDTQPQKFSPEDLQFLKTLANRAATAIAKVQEFSLVQQQAITDHVTGINNRRQLYTLGELEFKRAKRFNRPLTAIMIDIDNFKLVNDTYGHAQGDQVLHKLAQFLKIHLREFDILGRYGGEEFAIVLPGADLNSARNVAYRLREGVQERPMANGSLSITISLGVAEMSKEITDFQALLDKADMAMYEAKRAGRNRVMWSN